MIIYLSCNKHIFFFTKKEKLVISHISNGDPIAACLKSIQDKS